MSTHRHHLVARARRGFTLPETLVALVLFILAVGVLGEAANNGLFILSKMEVKDGIEQDVAMARAQVLNAQTLDDLTTGGDIQTPDAGSAHWQADYETTQTVNLFRVTMNVTLEGQGDVPSQSATQVLYLFRPSWGNSDDATSLLTDFHTNINQNRDTQAWP